MRYLRHRWEDPYDGPRKPSRHANWRRLPFWAFRVLIALALLALVPMRLAVASSLTVIS
ncbi:MAG: hypothetical protein OYH76_00495 [Defluviicoccus sp.]|nr:hypothetical protein [Defluviicoccus sp.]MDE0274342.1 hypothetical protein [Defluviicoccus sp.]